MNSRVISAAAVVATLLFAAAASGLAQGQPPRQGGPGGPPPRGAPPPQAAAKPYKPVAITAPKAVEDPSLEAFRKQVIAAAEKKDRKALAGLVVAQGFFVMGEKGDIADKRKSGVDNLAKALPIDPRGDDGWQKLAGMASDPTGMPFPQKKDTLCSPAYPGFNEQEFEALMQSTGTEDWAFPLQDGVEVHATAQLNSPLVEKLGMHFVRVMQSNEQTPVSKVVTPSGKTGYVPAEVLGSLADDQICYGKDASGWKIVGYIGG